MSSINNVTIAGRLTRDPETVGNGAVVKFTLAVDRQFKNRNGERETDFIRCVAFGKTGEFVQSWGTKGRMTAVTGSLQISEYTDRDGNQRQSAEINCNTATFLDSPKQNDRPTEQADDYEIDDIFG